MFDWNILPSPGWMPDVFTHTHQIGISCEIPLENVSSRDTFAHAHTRSVEMDGWMDAYVILRMHWTGCYELSLKIALSLPTLLALWSNDVIKYSINLLCLQSAVSNGVRVFVCACADMSGNSGVLVGCHREWACMWVSRWVCVCVSLINECGHSPRKRAVRSTFGSYMREKPWCVHTYYLCSEAERGKRKAEIRRRKRRRRWRRTKNVHNRTRMLSYVYIEEQHTAVRRLM